MLGIETSVTQLVFEASSGVTSWAAALDQIAAYLGASAACLNVHGAGASRSLLPATERYANMLDEFYRDGWSSQDLRAKRGWGRLLRGAPVLLENDLSAPEERRRLQIYEDFFARHDLGTWATMGMSVGDELWVCSIARSTQQGDFAGDEARRIRRVREGLKPALDIARKLNRNQHDVLLANLELQGIAAILIGFAGRVSGCTRHAEELLGSDVQVRNGTLHIGDRSAVVLLAPHLPPARDWMRQTSSSIVIRRRQGRPLIATPTPIYGPAADVLGSGGLLITLSDLERTRLPDLELLRPAFGVTTAELRVARLLTLNRRIDQISKELAVGSETVRKHLKSLFVKCGCHTQAELARLIGNLPSDLGVDN